MGCADKGPEHSGARRGRDSKWSRRRAVFAPAVVTGMALLAAAGCTSGTARTAGSDTTSGASSSSNSTTAESSSGQCVVSDKGVPSCGALWGVATRPPTAAGVQGVETKVGRTFDFVYRYHDLNDTIPDAAERALVGDGRLLHIAIAARDFGDRGTQITWAQVARGDFDKSLHAQALGVASLKVPVFMTFQQEANQKRKVDTLGTPADFIAAWRHIHDLYAQAGVRNAVWVWVMTGSADNLDAAAKLWPGNSYVDWISWNVYNQSGCASNQISTSKYVSFEDKMRIFYDFIRERGPSIGMDITKPEMISEAGSAQYPDNPSLTGQWYQQIPGVLQRYPAVKAVALWNSVDGHCDYRFDQVPQVADAVKEAGLNPYVNTRPSVEAVPTP